MNLFKKFKRFRLKRKINKIVASKGKKFHYLDKTKKVALIINSSELDLARHSELFIDFLKQNQINYETLYFITQKENKKTVLPQNTISVYGYKWINSDIVKKIAQEKFDILFVFNFQELYEIHYLTKLFNAGLKVAPNYQETNIADLTFKLKELTNPEEFFDAVKHYLVRNEQKEAI